MAEQPSEFPEWASAPPPDTITSPSTPTREAGYQPGPPRRQYTNWLFELIYRWIMWFWQVTFRVQDFFVDQALLVGTAPVTGTGLTVTAGSFSGRVYVDGYSIGPDPVDAPAHVYAANSDTYWDLDVDGAWTAAVVASGDPAPALTANSVRVYRVRTNGTDRTAIADYRRSRIKALPHEIGVAGDEIDENNSRILVRYNGDGTGAFGSDPHFTPLSESRPLETATGRAVVRIYASASGRIYVVFDAVWSGDDLEWSADGSGAGYFRYILDGNTVTAQTVSGGGPWVESDWVSADTQVSIDMVLALLQPMLLQMPVGGRQQVAMFDSTDGTFGLYVSLDGTGSFGPCLELVRNARWNSGLSRWERVASGDVTKLDIGGGIVGGAGGAFVRRLVHDAGYAANFSDTINPASTWALPLKHLRFSGAAFQVNDGLSGSGFDGAGNAARPGTVGGGARFHIATASSVLAWLELRRGDIPDGSILVSAEITISNPTGNGDTSVAVVRIPSPYDSGAAVEALRLSTGSMDVVPQVSGGIPSGVQTVSITLDANEADRTIDRSAWVYGIHLEKTHTDAAVYVLEVALAYYDPRSVS